MWKKYIFTDGTVVICKGYSKSELKWAEYHHGKLLKVETAK